MLIRLPKSQLIAVEQYKAIKVANEMCTKTQGLVDGETVAKILEYLNDGIYGENSKRRYVPEVEMEGF